MDNEEKKYAKYADMVAPERIERWLDRAGTSPKTKSAYLDGMMALFAYVRDCGLEFDELSEDDIFSFKDHFVENGYKPSTVSIYLAGIRSFYRFVEKDEEDGVDIACGVKGMKAERGFKKEVLHREQARELLASIETDTLKGKRDFAIVNLMIRTGLRDVEVVRALVGDVKFQDGEVATLRVQGKGRQSKDDFVVLDEATLSPIRDYLLARKGCEDGDSLFASVARRNCGDALTTRSLSRIVKSRLNAIGLTGDEYTAHSLRHTAVTYSLLGGATVQEAQAMARHSDINTTLIYAHNIERLRNPAESKASFYLDEG